MHGRARSDHAVRIWSWGMSSRLCTPVGRDYPPASAPRPAGCVGAHASRGSGSPSAFRFCVAFELVCDALAEFFGSLARVAESGFHLFVLEAAGKSFGRRCRRVSKISSLGLQFGVVEDFGQRRAEGLEHLAEILGGVALFFCVGPIEPPLLYPVVF